MDKFYFRKRVCNFNGLLNFISTYIQIKLCQNILATHVVKLRGIKYVTNCILHSWLVSYLFS